MRTHSRILLGLATALALVLAACGDDGDDTAADTTTTATADDSGTETDDERFVKDVQGQLSQIGCYEGEIDGVDGSETQAAIEAFQRAEGLAVDDIVGPATEEALKEAVASGRHDVCDGGDATTTTAEGNVTTTTQGDVTTSTGGGGGGTVAPCTHDAIQAALGAGENLDRWQCARTSQGQDYAGGTQHAGTSPDRTDFILWARDGRWTAYDGSCDDVPDLVKEFCTGARG